MEKGEEIIFHFKMCTCSVPGEGSERAGEGSERGGGGESERARERASERGSSERARE